MNFIEDANLDMVVLDAKSMDDIDSIMLNVSEVFEGRKMKIGISRNSASSVDILDSELVDETDSRKGFMTYIPRINHYFFIHMAYSHIDNNTDHAYNIDFFLFRIKLSTYQ